MGKVSKESLGVFLGELRAGTNVETAACVSDIPIDEALRIEANEKRGAYRHTPVTPSPLSVDGDVISIAMSGGRPPARLHFDLGPAEKG